MPLYAKVWDTSSPHNTGTREDGNRNAALSDWETLMPDADARDRIGPYPVVIRMGPYASPLQKDLDTRSAGGMKTVVSRDAQATLLSRLRDPLSRMGLRSPKHAYAIAEV